MARDATPYAERRSTRTAPWEGYKVDEPIAGFYRMRRGAESVYRPVALWYGPPLDPETGEPMDRSHRWQALFCGRFIWDIGLVWPYCADGKIDLLEYEYLLERVRFAREHDRRDPFGTASGKIDWLTSTPP